MSDFWSELKKPASTRGGEPTRGGPILCLAPMADVTDAAFRYVIAKYSKTEKGYPFVTWTEFVSADGLVRATPEGKKKLMKGLEFNDMERPIVAQLFTSKPEMMEEAAKIVLELGFDGLDINMGCPDKNIEKQGAGAALIKNPKLAHEIIAAAKRGVQNKIPVSVKTRLGYNKDELETWLPELLAEEPAVITVHARTRKEMSKVPARWERVKRAVEIRDEFESTNLPTGQAGAQSARPNDAVGQASKTLIFGNGDVESPEQAIKLCEETGADGVMLGRAIFGTPWLFSYSHELENKKIVEILAEHIKLFDEKFRGMKSFAVMKKHFKAYLPFDKELRDKMLKTESVEEALSVLDSHYNQLEC
jgi:tRNA-dihydrouridine synthase